MSDRPFLDTNVILYAFRADDPRGEIAEALMALGGTVSVQVLNEFAAVARGELKKTWKEIRQALNVVLAFCPSPLPLTIDTHERAIRIAERYKYSCSNSLIIASALEAGVETLYSEDMRNGQTIDGLVIRNPFS